MNTKSPLLSIQADLDLIPKEVPGQRILEIVVTAPQMEAKAQRPEFNLALVLDRSGSMSGDKLKYVKLAAEHVLDLLDERDRVALVVFDNDVTLLSPSLPASKAACQEMKAILRHVEVGGMTNLSGGWLTGCQMVAEAAAPGQINRTLLLTDGLANVGITDMEELGVHSRQLHARGVSTSTFGVGEGFNEHLLELISNQGGGNFHYIADPQQIPEIFARELSELATLTARSIELDIELPPQVDVQVLAGWKQVNESNHLRISLGDLASGRSCPVYLRLLTPPSSQLAELEFRVVVRAKGEGQALYEQKASLVLHYTEKAAFQAARLDPELMRRFSTVEVAESANEALKLEREGKLQQARQVLDRSMAAAAPYLPGDVQAQYQQLSRNIEHGLSEKGRKDSHYTNYQTRRNRGNS